jgi:hypothetical protein
MRAPGRRRAAAMTWRDRRGRDEIEDEKKKMRAFWSKFF